MTKQTVGKIFITSGLLSVVYCVVLYFTGPIKLQYGMLLNIILFSLDCIWFLSFGFLWAMFGVIILKGSDTYVWKIKIGGFSYFHDNFFTKQLCFQQYCKPSFQFKRESSYFFVSITFLHYSTSYYSRIYSFIRRNSMLHSSFIMVFEDICQKNSMKSLGIKNVSNFPCFNL